MASRLIDPALRRDIESVFEAALDIGPADRSEWLLTRCGPDERLRADVAALLDAHHYRAGILETDIARAAGAALDGVARGRRIGPYRVIRELGRGGMGIVYLAERDDGQNPRRVAIKLLRANPDADDLQRRFAAERQILASLRHRGIAQLLDAGVTD